jgi:Xaa-Pro aminopeptidase
MDSLYLVDSGGQYPDGTTDVTRTVAIGTPTAEMRDRFTRVLKGHIALGSQNFPEGTRGTQLDVLARQFLWSAGLDYAHGTGHGVGSYLAVHEGPQRISPAGSSQAGGDEPLRAGMICSNEPGYYKTGEYGIRVENLVLVVPVEVEGAEKKMLGFETLTFAPIDRSLIETAMLTTQERRWVDDYHARVLEVVGPQLGNGDLDWLKASCAPL